MSLGFQFIVAMISLPHRVKYIIDLIHHEQDVDGSIYEQVVADGYVPLTFQIVSTWGADDQPIFDYVAQELSITLV